MLMQRLSRTARAWSFLALSLFLGAGCDSDAETAEAETRASGAMAGDPLAAIPPEELYGASPLDNLWTPRYELEVVDLPEGWSGKRVAVLSDFQLGLWDQNEAVATAAVERAVSAQPDLIVLLGDFVAQGNDMTALQRVLAPLRGRGALAVLGDRDIRSDSIEAQIAATLQTAGIRLLSNNSVPIVLGDDTAYVAGADPDLVGEPGADQEWVLLNAGPPGRTPILLTHNAGLAPRAPEGQYPVILAGNAFCGDIEVAGSPRLSWLRENVFPGSTVEGVENLFIVDRNTVMVSCGVGYGFVPLRFGAAPEVPIVTLVRRGGVAPIVGDSAGVQGAIPDSLIERYQGSPDSAAAPSVAAN